MTLIENHNCHIIEITDLELKNLYYDKAIAIYWGFFLRENKSFAFVN